MSERDESALAGRECLPCREGAAPLRGEALEKLQAQLGGGWEIVAGHHLEQDFKFADFREALAFVNRVGELAEAVNHHPDIHLAWGRARIVIWTHGIDGLAAADFIFAAKVGKIAPAP